MKRIGRTVIIWLLGCNLFCALAAVERPARFVSAEEVVAWLYRDFGWECFLAHSFEEDILCDQPQQVLKRYFTPQLSDWIVRDRAYVEKTRELGHVDFVLLFGSQDPDGVGNLRIERLPGTDKVKVVYDQNGERDVMELQFAAVETDKGWRIADIRYISGESAGRPGPGFSLLEILSQPYK
jgi:hypothetical protein